MDAKTTGKIINEKRKEKGMTQLQLAQVLNISNRAVSKWENGDGFPDITLLPDISKALDITIDELLTGIKPKPIIKTVESNESSRSRLLNDFKIGFVASLFMTIFAALLGSITELYCIWAFPILFYTHWEIMFAAVSLFCIVAGNLVFFISAIRLHLEFSQKEIISIAVKKGLLLISTSVIFPLLMLTRIVDISRWGVFTPYIMIAVTALTAIIIIKVYKKIKNSMQG